MADTQAKETTTQPGERQARAHITVVLYSFNHRAYVDDALDSILAQASPPDAILIADDGSTDGTRERILERLMPTGIARTCADIETNHGLLFRIRQATSSVSHGYIVNMSGDDALAPICIAAHRSIIERTRTRWSIGSVAITDSALKTTSVHDHVRALSERNCDLHRAALESMPIYSHGWCFAVSLCREAGGYDSSGSYLDDYPLLLRMLRIETPVLHSNVVAYYRQIAGSITNSDKALRVAEELALWTLREAKRRPLIALRAASSRYYAAAVRALGSRQPTAFARNLALAAITWPSPSHHARYAAKFARRAWR